MKQRKVCIVTGTRAEYGLLYPILKKIQASESLELQLIATTMHVSPEFGNTYKQIEADGFVIDETVENLLTTDSASSMAKSSGLATLLLSDAFRRLAPDVILLLGDRFETLAAATAALLMNIPVAHIHGGEITEGAVDEQIRHAITKMSYWHFVATPTYARRVIQMGESPSRVFCTGAPGIDNVIGMKRLTRQELEADLAWKFGDKSALFTYHPVTLETTDLHDDINKIFEVLQHSGLNILFTYANADEGGLLINRQIELFCSNDPVRYRVVKSLGQQRYLSAMTYVNVLIGNSSSGIIEAASFHKPVVNIGNRQRGRLQSGNVVDCEIDTLDAALSKALSHDFISQCQKIENIYGTGNAAQQIVDILEREPLNTVKKFIDIKS